MNSINYEESLEYVMKLYGDDIDRTAIETDVCFLKPYLNWIMVDNDINHKNKWIP